LGFTFSNIQDNQVKRQRNNGNRKALYAYRYAYLIADKGLWANIPLNLVIEGIYTAPKAMGIKPGEKSCNQL